MIIENKPIKNVGNLGHITLDKLALPYSVKVSFQGEQIIPLSFDIFGHPNFTKEQTRIFRLKQAEISRESKDNSLPVVEISYEERVFDKPKNYFDSIMAVQDKIVTLSFFYELLNDRALFIKSHPNQTLNEFVVFGWLLLDKFGSVRLVKATKEEREKLIKHDIVETYESFKNNNSSISFYSTRYHVPKDGTICQCCCNKFMMKDFKDSPCIYIDGKFYHDSCYRNYRELIEINRFTLSLMDHVYEPNEYTYELLPNGYDPNSYSPWILFHTIDGDIVIGSNTRISSIRIEWRNNYSSFDIDNIFRDEDISIEENNGNYIITAQDIDYALKYLCMVRNAIPEQH